MSIIEQEEYQEGPCIHCNSPTPYECLYCDRCDKHSIVCQGCKIDYCPCKNTLMYLMPPRVSWVKDRPNIQNTYCSSCVDVLIERSFVSQLVSREVGISKRRKISMKWDDGVLDCGFCQSTPAH